MSEITAKDTEQANIVRCQAEVDSCSMVARSTARMRLRLPELARMAGPGQFVMVGPLDPDSCDPFLNRPFSLHRKPDEDTLELLIGVVGRGTEFLTRLGPGSRLWTLGPLGNGFRVAEEMEKLILVGGGLGIAPLFFLAETARASGKQVHLLYGAATEDLLVPTDDLKRAGVQVQLATDDGTRGLHGTAVDLLDALGEQSIGGKTSLAACGPEVMLRALVSRARAIAPGLDIQVSLETRMACGMGACVGCTIFLADGRGQRVCCEGPVFDAGEVFGP
jgi:dihydroorotate dehydrogenase electron transfer subunit